MTTVAEYQERRDKLTSALRSGDYKQTQGYLRTTEGFCCLGVACDISKDDLGLEWEQPTEFVNIPFEMEGNQGILPESVKEYYGFKKRDSSYNKHDDSLTTKNDKGDTFEEIADFIDKNPNLLFVKGTY